MITIWETQPHYGRHLRPIANELTCRGVPHTYLRGHELPAGGDVLVVAAYRDLRRYRRRFTHHVLVEHGIGQSYGNAHPAYPDGIREPYDLHLTPGPSCADPAAVDRVEVGCLPLAGVQRLQRAVRTVGLTWHWPCTVAPEAGTAWEEHRAVLPQLAAWARRHDTLLLGHQHPRWRGALNAAYHDALIERVRDPDTLLAEADVLVADNTSLLLEAAALGTPVIMVNAQAWRRDITHGKRFWAWADLGLQVNDPGELIRAVEETLCCDPQEARRTQIVRECYGLEPTGGASRAVGALLGLL